jgi:hypothetical protein
MEMAAVKDVKDLATDDVTEYMGSLLLLLASLN